MRHYICNTNTNVNGEEWLIWVGRQYPKRGINGELGYGGKITQRVRMIKMFPKLFGCCFSDTKLGFIILGFIHTVHVHKRFYCIYVSHRYNQYTETNK